MSRARRMSREVTFRQMHRHLISLPRNSRVITIPMNHIKPADIMHLGLPALFVLALAIMQFAH